MKPTQVSISTITVSQLQELGDAVHLLDVRTPIEFQEVHARGAVSTPLDELNPVEAARSAGGKRIAILCHSGKRATRAAEKFLAADIPNVVVVEGGTEAWIKAGLPTERAPLKVLPLMRQVQVVVGSLVLAGTVLGYLVHPAFLIVPAFCGAGLFFAGATGFCGMAILLSKMPWNRVDGSGCGTSCSTK